MPPALQARAGEELTVRVEMLAVFTADLQGIETTLGPDAGRELLEAIVTLWTYYERLLAAVGPLAHPFES